MYPRIPLFFMLVLGGLIVTELAYGDTALDAKNVANLMRAEQFNEIRAKFSPALAQQLSADQMRSVWTNMIAQAGQVTAIGEPTVSQQTDHLIADVRCTCQKATIVVRVVYNTAAKIDGIWVFPGS